MLDIGPEKTNVYPIRQTGKRKGQKNVIHIYARLERVINMGFGYQQWVIPINYIYVNYIEVCIIEKDRVLIIMMLQADRGFAAQAAGQ